MMDKKALLTLGLIFIIQALNAQITISKSQVDYSLKIEQDKIIRILTFWKDKDSTTYTSIKYSVSNFNTNASEKNLLDEISYINQLWEIADDSIDFKLQSFNIGYPLLYSDILINHIRAFQESNEWQNHVKQNGKKLNYHLIQKIMIENDVYSPLNSFLKTKNYTLSAFETEKHGFVTKENLQKAGFHGNEIIPMPFIVWAVLEQ
ncbi:MAG: hypothetical protein R6V23_03920 [Bacteroidales bacterium]